MILSDEVIVPTETISFEPIVKLPFNTVALFKVDAPATNKLPKPAPPLTLKAPVDVDDEVSVVSISTIFDDVNVPTNVVAPVNVVVSATNKLPTPTPPLTLNAPVEVDDDVRVESISTIFDEVNLPTKVVAPVNVVAPAINKLPIPAPPFTLNAPVDVDDDVSVELV